MGWNNSYIWWYYVNLQYFPRPNYVRTITSCQFYNLIYSTHCVHSWVNNNNNITKWVRRWYIGKDFVDTSWARYGTVPSSSGNRLWNRGEVTCSRSIEPVRSSFARLSTSMSLPHTRSIIHVPIDIHYQGYAEVLVFPGSLREENKQRESTNIKPVISCRFIFIPLHTFRWFSSRLDINRYTETQSWISVNMYSSCTRRRITQ